MSVLLGTLGLFVKETGNFIYLFFLGNESVFKHWQTIRSFSGNIV